MKALFLDYYYEHFLDGFHKSHSNLDVMDLNSYRDLLMKQRLCGSDSLAHHFKLHGWEAEEIVTNDPVFLQKIAKELNATAWILPVLPAKFLNRYLGWDSRFQILKKYIQAQKPDILFIQERSIFTDAMISELKKHVRMTICLIGSPIPPWRTFQSTDLVLSCLKSFVDHFRSREIRAEYFRLCADERIVNEVSERERADRIPISFVGGLTKVHKKRQSVLEHAAKELPVSWFGYADRTCQSGSALHKSHQKEAWGIDMYKILARSDISLNCHIDIAGTEAANMRMFEATLMKSCLVTDGSLAVAKFFEPDSEVIVYDSKEELVEKCKYLLTHPEHAREVARKGHERTMREHTYVSRIPELIKIIESNMP